jgi:molybdate/tungstate transport system substrate-binding protein
VSLLAAGSLSHALERRFRPAIDVRLAVEAAGSARLARLVAEGLRDPDILALADTALFDRLGTWYAAFATNALVLAYDADSPGGRAVADAGTDWFRPLLDGRVRFGRTDPDLDPLGYRTLFALELATDYYRTDRDLRAAVPSPDQVYPETGLLSRFETGAVEAAVVYRNMALARGYDYLDLPAAVDLSDPRRKETYAAADYELPDGTVVEGGPVVYGTTLRRHSPVTVRVFERHATGDYLDAAGLTVPDGYPRYTEDAPDALAA